ncbi:MAG: hypothetical protein P9X24_00240 [Candidatus Hatepunaea meridiana]|nr:hypothetical protein [Candidatus Hatepunaea meridiana]
MQFKLRNSVIVGAIKSPTNVGWQGESFDIDVYWYLKHKYWCHFDANQTENRYWNTFLL